MDYHFGILGICKVSSGSCIYPYSTYRFRATTSYEMSHWPETRVSLIRRLADRNDAEAWAYFEAHYQQPVYRFARSHGLQPDDALDVVQEVLIAVHKSAANWSPSGHVGSFRAWLAEAARRVTMQITSSTVPNRSIFCKSF